MYEGGEVHTGLWWEGLRERDPLKDPGIDGRIIKWIFGAWDVRAWAGSILVRVGTGGGLL
jgi:hypothetical protein